jgi:hypothetical protein
MRGWAWTAALGSIATLVALLCIGVTSIASPIPFAASIDRAGSRLLGTREIADSTLEYTDGEPR